MCTHITRLCERDRDRERLRDREREESIKLRLEDQPSDGADLAQPV